MTRRRALGLLAVIGMLGLVGCSPISSGTITDKVTEPGFFYVIPMCSSYNKDGVCTLWVQIPMYDDPDWRFDLRSGSGDNAQTGFVYVTEETFGQYEIGDYFDGDVERDEDVRTDTPSGGLPTGDPESLPSEPVAGLSASADCEVQPRSTTPDASAAGYTARPGEHDERRTS